MNAAGVFLPKPFLEHTPADYDLYLDLNRATFFVTQRVARQMAARGRGAVVTIGSMWARQAVKDGLFYLVVLGGAARLVVSLSAWLTSPLGEEA